MFEEFQGIPLHPLLVHSAVVLLPLQALAGIAYGVLPRYRRYVGWFAVGVAVAAPVAVYVTRLSGLALRERLIRNGTSDAGVLAKIQQHNDFADAAFYSSLALGVLMLGLVALQVMRARQMADGGASPAGLGVVMLILIVLTIGAAGATGYYVFRTGDTGAKMTWTGR